MKNKVICIFGPTASGKTALAIDLASYFPCQIISVDSALIYRGMDVGTAKPTAEELAATPHRLVDICDPVERYSVGQFLRDVELEIEESLAQGKVPILVGGTMMYFFALQNGLAQLPQVDLKIRAEIEMQAQQQGWGALHAQLQKVDPSSAKQIHPNDPQRIQRALEVYYSTGIALSQLQQEQAQAEVFYDFLNIALQPEDRGALHQRIDQRLQKMFADGFLAEVENLFQRGDLHSDLPSIRTVGYRQVWSYLQGEIDFATAQQQALFATRQLAKRQLTWMKKFKQREVISIETKNKINSVLNVLREQNYLNSK